MKSKEAFHTSTDLELILSYQKEKDIEFIGILYKRYVSLVFGLCYKYLENQHDAEDATANIFQILIEKLKDNHVTHFKSWLYIVSKNYVLGEFRKNKNQKTIFQEEFSENIMENEEEFHLNIDSNQIQDFDQLLKLGLESLKEAQQVCLELFYLQSKSYVQIAQMTGFDLNQVKSHIQNGKRNLKIFLESKGYNHE